MKQFFFICLILSLCIPAIASDNDNSCHTKAHKKTKKSPMHNPYSPERQAPPKMSPSEKRRQRKSDRKNHKEEMRRDFSVN